LATALAALPPEDIEILAKAANLIAQSVLRL
jgi:hypothetical protein